MVAPIRIQGAKYNPAHDPLDMSLVPEAGSEISYTSPSGEVWGLWKPTVAEARGLRVVLKESGLQGAVGRVEYSESESVTRYGNRPAGPHEFRVPPLEGTLDYVLRDKPRSLRDTSNDWRRSWVHGLPGKLRVISREGGNYWTPASLVSLPDIPRELKGERLLEEQLSWRSRIGHWWGSPKTFTGITSVMVGGDVPLSPSCRLLWDGTATSVTFPSGVTVTLPAIREDGAPSPWMRAINLDRGMSGQVTVVSNGFVDPDAWAALQGTILGVTLAPHVPSSWSLGAGLTLEVTPRYLSPWR